MRKKLVKFFYVINSLVLLFPLLAMAQPNIVPPVDLSLPRVYSLFVNIMNWIFSFAIVLAVIIIIWGGITYMTAGGDETKTGTAKKRVLYGLLGVAVILAAWGLIFLISQFLQAPIRPPTG